MMFIVMGCGSSSTQIGESNTTDYQTKYMNEQLCNQIVDNEFMLICYDYGFKVAKSVSYTLYGDLVNELNIEKRPSFYQEDDIPSEYRAKDSDYTHSGYDRGHMAPDASFDWSQESLDATYSLANIIPQAPNVNRYMWKKAEDYAREKAVEIGELNIINIIKYTDTNSVIGEGKISVSQGYYKILYNHDKEFEECLYYGNDLNISSSGDKVEFHFVNCLEVGY